MSSKLSSVAMELSSELSSRKVRKRKLPSSFTLEAIKVQEDGICDHRRFDDLGKIYIRSSRRGLCLSWELTRAWTAIFGSKNENDLFGGLTDLGIYGLWPNGLYLCLGFSDLG